MKGRGEREGKFLCWVIWGGCQFGDCPALGMAGAAPGELRVSLAPVCVTAVGTGPCHRRGEESREQRGSSAFLGTNTNWPQ